ncbi:hypothetical protein F2Q69_00024866 [Brassica cretica]|uniref:Uncharacterized protein n=1 Tax=Brassica cretica TaxID=69181 RepID=A0A8S9Q970_BRACR|nr:hypothetical protein F2Q69_00024866 [Brassica cretica]
MVLRERHSCVAPKTSLPAGATSCARSRKSLPGRLIHERLGLAAVRSLSRVVLFASDLALSLRRRRSRSIFRAPKRQKHERPRAVAVVTSLHMEQTFILAPGCVESLSSSDDWMAGPVQSSSGTKRVQGWSAKEEINLQKEVQVYVQALEQLGSQLKTIYEGDGYSEWQWDCHIPFIRRLKKIMKELQTWLKVELREVRRDKRRQRDAEDEQVCSKHLEVLAQSKGYGLGPNRWSFVRFGQSPLDMFNVGSACTSYAWTTDGPNR